MATSTPTVNKFKPGYIPANKEDSIFVRKITFAVTTSGGAGDGYYSGDTISLIGVVPDGCAIVGLWYKTSVTQGATLTFAPQLDAGSAFVSAVNLTSTTPAALTLVPANCFVAAGNAGTINLVLAGTTVGTTAATITLYLTIAAFEPPVGQTVLAA